MKQLIFTQTRPPPEKLLAELRSLHIEPCWQPLLALQEEVSEDFCQGIESLERFAGIVVVSPAAAALAMPRITHAWPELPEAPAWYAVGKSTARTLQKWGIDPKTPEPETSEGLLSLPGLLRPKGQSWWILAGRGGRNLLAETLSGRGAEVQFGYLYRRRPKPLQPGLLREGARRVICVASGGALRALAGSPGIQMHDFSGLVVPSLRLANLARNDYGCKCLLVAEGAGPRALAEAAIRLLGK